MSLAKDSFIFFLIMTRTKQSVRWNLSELLFFFIQVQDINKYVLYNYSLFFNAPRNFNLRRVVYFQV